LKAPFEIDSWILHVVTAMLILICKLRLWYFLDLEWCNEEEGVVNVTSIASSILDECEEEDMLEPYAWIDW